MTFIPNGLQLIAEQTISGAAVTTITFNNLDINTDRLYKLLFSCKNPTGSNVTYNLFYNNDTTLANYANQFINGSGGVTGGRQASSSQFLFLEAGLTGFSIGDIILDPSSNGRFTATASRGPLATVQVELWAGVYVKAGTTNITRLDITGNVASSIGIGSVARLFRVSPI